eukprot:jgi/Mesvir1/16255/Mv08503-RA.1
MDKFNADTLMIILNDTCTRGNIMASTTAIDACRVPSGSVPILGAPIKFNLRHVAAPMVGQSDLAFRMICRRHGADVAYSEMLLSDKFISDPAYRSARLQTCDADRPLVVQFAGDDADTLLTACRLVEGMCDAVDLNLGCPQKAAMEGHYGAYMCDKKDWPLVCDIVRHLAHHLSIPVFCKIRLQATRAMTVEFAKLLANAGCSLVAVHGRQRGGFNERRKGPADLVAVRMVVETLAPLGVPVLSNGNVRCPADIEANLRATGAAGIMVGEALLANPMVFAHVDCTRENVMAAVQSYLDECARHPPHEWAVVQAHLFWMLGKTGGGEWGWQGSSGQGP